MSAQEALLRALRGSRRVLRQILRPSSNPRCAQGLTAFDLIRNRLSDAGDKSLSIVGMGEQLLGDEFRGVQFRVGTREFRTIRGRRFSIDTGVPNDLSDLGALL